jgi:hypothetical protein
MSIQTFDASRSLVNIKKVATTHSVIVAGFVVANPASGEIKAVMPHLGLYSDIPADAIRLIGSQHERTSPIILAESAPTNNTEISFAGAEASGDGHESIAVRKPSLRRVIMKHLLDFDARDLAVMIGTASLAGSVTNMTFNAVQGVDTPIFLAVAVACLGFAVGRKLSWRLRNPRHG